MMNGRGGDEVDETEEGYAHLRQEVTALSQETGKGCSEAGDGERAGEENEGAQQQAYTEANDDDPSAEILHLSECLPKAQWHCAARVWHRLPGLPLRTGFWW